MTRKVEWWGRARDEEPGAPLHRMMETDEDIFRRTVCTKEPGDGHVTGKSEWAEEERCQMCRFLVVAREL